MKNILNLERFSEPEDVLIADPIRDATRISRRNLLFSTVIVLIALAYGGEAINFPIVNLPAKVVIGALGGVTAYYLISFLINFSNDVQALNFAKSNIIGKEQLEALQNLSTRMSELKYEVDSLDLSLKSHETVYKEQFDLVTKPILSLLKAPKVEGAEYEAKQKLSHIVDMLNRYLTPPYGQSTEVSKAIKDDYRKELIRAGKALQYFEGEAKSYRKKEQNIRAQSRRLRVFQLI